MYVSILSFLIVNETIRSRNRNLRLVIISTLDRLLQTFSLHIAMVMVVLSMCPVVRSILGILAVIPIAMVDGVLPGYRVGIVSYVSLVGWWPVGLTCHRHNLSHQRSG